MNRRRRCRRRDPFVPEKQWRLPVINNDLISYLRKGRRFEEIESQPVRESRVPRAPLSPSPTFVLASKGLVIVDRNGSERLIAKDVRLK